MTAEKKAQEIGTRVIRLSDLRGELAVARKRRDDAIALLRHAGQYAPNYLDKPPEDDEWLSPADLRDRIKAVMAIEKEARQNISELRELGADADLFRLNGD